MTLQQQQRELDALDQDADVIAPFVATLDTGRLCMLANVINDELIMRNEGKPLDRALLH